MSSAVPGPMKLIDERVALLTRRERDVYALMAAAIPTREIASRLGMKYNTVENYRNRVNRVLGYLAPWYQRQRSI